MLVDLQSLFVEQTDHIQRHRRGPLRPQQLVCVRRRQSRRLAGHRFRAVDTLLLAGATVLVAGLVIDGPVLAARLADALPVLAGMWTLWRLLRWMGLYRLGRSERLLSHLGRVGISAAISAGVALVLNVALPAERTTVTALVGGFAGCAAALMAAHAVWYRRVVSWRTQGLLTPNLVVLGATAHAEGLIASAIERRDINILGIFDDRYERSPLALLGVPVLGNTEEMLRHRVMPYVDIVVVAIDPAATARAREVMTQVSVLPNRLTLVFDGPGVTRRAAAIEQLVDAPLASLDAASDADRRTYAKRIQDLVIGIAALVVTAPFLALIALAVRIDSPGPVFFRQRRHGFNNEEIVVWKFRTMRHDAADARSNRQVTANDDRVTRVGRILRTTSLDEVPQLLNVIAGEMSLVGPRPHAIGMKTGDVESDRLVAEYAHRHRIKPGMTGWAAVHGSRGPMHAPEDVVQRVALDLEYIERQSFWLDLQIMLKSIPGMLGDRDAVR